VHARQCGGKHGHAVLACEFLGEIVPLQPLEAVHSIRARLASDSETEQEFLGLFDRGLPRRPEATKPKSTVCVGEGDQGDVDGGVRGTARAPYGSH
jgi:hypothetical protein